MNLKNFFQNKKQSLSWSNKDITIILDNGHGKNTSGKCSPKWPDGSQLFEWEFKK